MDPPKKCRRYDFIHFNRPDIIDKFERGPAAPREKTETRAERKRRLRREKKKYQR